MELREMAAIIENYPDATQRFLWEVLKEILFRKKGPVKVKPCPELDDILSTGIIVPDGSLYGVSEQARKRIRKFYTYLRRKYGTELYYDPDEDKMLDIPAGATFVGMMDGSHGYSLQFPDDEVTELLNLFGVNPLEKWPQK